MKMLLPMIALGLLALSPARADDTPLAEQMGIVNDSYKAMRRTDDAAEGAKLAREAQEATLKSIGMTPGFVENGSHPGGQEVAMVSFRKQLGQLFVSLCEVEAAFLAEDFDKVKELIQAIRESKKAGHDEFMEEE